MNKIGFVTREEYEAWYGIEAQYTHVRCETPRHKGQMILAIVVIVIMEPDNPSVFGACPECFGLMDDDLGPEANWHLRQP